MRAGVFYFVLCFDAISGGGAVPICACQLLMKGEHDGGPAITPTGFRRTCAEAGSSGAARTGTGKTRTWGVGFLN